jgi:hypothetical protein
MASMTSLETIEQTSSIEALQEAVLLALTKPQTMSEQLRTQLADHYTCLTDEQIQAFFAEGFLKLEEYEEDLLFSPQFTVKAEQRLAFASPFALNAYTKEAIEASALAIEALKRHVTFRLASGLEVQVPLSAVIAERFMKSLHLHKPLPQNLRHFIESNVPEAFQAQVALALRDDIFQFEKYQVLFKDVANGLSSKNAWTPSQVDFVTFVIKTYTPQALGDLAEKLERLIQSCQEDMATAETRSYHHPQILGSNMGSSHDHHEAQAVKDNYSQIIKNAQDLKVLLQ